MAAAFQTVASATGSFTDTIVVSKPTDTVEGDLLVAFVNCRGVVSASTWTASGWTTIEDGGFIDLYQSFNLVVGAFWKKAGPSEASTYSFVNSGSALQISAISGAILRIDSQEATTPIAAAPAYAEAGTASAPDAPASGTVTSGDYLAIAAACWDKSANTPPGSYTERADLAVISVATRDLTGVTSENPGAFGVAAEYGWAAFTLLIAAASVATVNVYPDADTTTTGWTATPLFSKVDEDPASPDGVVISATAS